MGREYVDMTAATSVSRHNSAEDVRDIEAWNTFVASVRALAEWDAFKRLRIDITGGDIPVPPYGD